ncbi:MAG: exosortase-associated EpsI family protein [bacterium]|nr:exosortase-associated EpsI family protein [bacterium]
MIKFIPFILINIPAFLFIPWVWYAWFNSPLDKIGPLWFACSIVILLINLKYIYRSTDKIDYSACIIIFFSLCFYIISLSLQINIFALSSALLLVMGGIWFLYGWNSFLLTLPIYTVIFLSFPTTAYIFRYFINELHLPFIIDSELLKALIFLLAFAFSLYYPRQKKYHITKINGIYWLSAAFFISLILFYNSPRSDFSPSLKLSLTTTPEDGWYGEIIPLSNIEKKLYKDELVAKYIYYNKFGNIITIMSFKANNNLHNIHPPDYCLIGAGWDILSDTYINLNIKTRQYSIREITASMNNSKALIYSWYSSDKISTGDYKMFRLKQKKSIKSTWNAYLVSINFLKNRKNAEEKLSSFLFNKIDKN